MKVIIMRLARQKAQQKGVNLADTSASPSSRVSSLHSEDNPSPLPPSAIVPPISSEVPLILPLLSPIASLVLTLENPPSPAGILNLSFPSPSPSLAEEYVPIPSASLPLMTIVPPIPYVRPLITLPNTSPIAFPILTLESPPSSVGILNPNPLFPSFSFAEESTLIPSDCLPSTPLFPCVISSSPSPVASPPASPVSFSPNRPPTKVLSSPPKDLSPILMEMTIGPNEATSLHEHSVEQPL